MDLDFDPLLTGGAILILIVLSGFFYGSETALTATREARLSQQARKGSRAAQIVIDLKHRSDTLIGAIMIGNNIVNIFASALATSALIRIFGESGVVYATIGMTILLRRARLL